MAVFDKKTKTWRADITLGKKRIRKRGFLSKKTAELYESQKRFDYEREDLDLPTKDRLSIEELFDDYLEYFAQRKKQNTVKRDKTCLNQWCTFFMEKSIIYTGEISNDTWIKYIEWRNKQDNPPTKRTINLDLTTIRKIWNWAIDSGKVQKNPFEKISLFNLPKPGIPRYLKIEEIKYLEDLAKKTNKRLWQAIVILAHTGMRSGEFCTLEVSDINFDLGKIILRPEETKAMYPRSVPITEKIKPILIDLVVDAQKNDRKHISCTRTGKKQTPDGLGHRFRNLILRAEKEGRVFENVNIHTLRKTYISHLIMQGEDPAKVMEIVGHKEWKTIKRYLALSPSYLENVKKLPY